MATIWQGSPPHKCEVCSTGIKDEFADVRLPIRNGAWALIGPECYKSEYVKFGTGHGQRYRKEPRGFVKVEG